MTAGVPDSWTPLEQIEPGRRVTVQGLSGHPAHCRRLREMGFCELAEVEVLNNGGAMVCQVCDSKVCLSRRLAADILVEPCLARGLD